MIRPLEPEEMPYLIDLGRELKLMRLEAGLNRPQLAELVDLTSNHLLRIEHATSRTRRTTIERLVNALAAEEDTAKDRARTVDMLCEIAGPALAPPSRWPGRQERKRAKRRRRREVIEAEAARLVLQRQENPWP